ncbi:hypothetical protein BH24CHL1_BH24CHL1_10600 [soil metagenome]
MTTAEGCVLRHAQSFQDALHCVTQAKIKHNGWALESNLAVAFQHGQAVPLRRSGRRSPLFFEVAQGYRVFREPEPDDVPQYGLSVTYYEYRIMADDGREMIVFHWHPGRGGVNWPHLHVRSLMIDSSRHDLGRRFSTLHLPTSRVSIEQVVEALITQFDVTPLRADWQRILDAGQSAFKESRKWA